MDPDKLLKEFAIYDRSVDIVSAYHWLFTETDLQSTVSHFERYPKIKAGDGRDATPDFTVLFKDGTGVAAEIANIALHENSVDKLCRQLGRYDELSVLPDETGGFRAVSTLDVVYLSPMETAVDAARRVFVDRIDEPSHWYKPGRRPVLVQFARETSHYIFQFWPDSEANGKLYVGDRTPNYANYKSLKIGPDRFGKNKIQFSFMNDPIPPLYLATRLWSNVFPSAFTVNGEAEFEATKDGIVRLLKNHYGVGRSDDVKAAMEVLVAARLATQSKSDRSSWTVNRKGIRRISDDVHKVIAERLNREEPTRSNSLRRFRHAAKLNSGQEALF